MQVRSKTRIFDVPTPAEDDAINAGALSDPDNPPLTDAQLSQFKRLRGQRGPRRRRSNARSHFDSIPKSSISTKQQEAAGKAGLTTPL